MARRLIAASLGFLMTGVLNTAVAMQPEPTDVGSYTYAIQDATPAPPAAPKTPKGEKPEKPEKAPKPPQVRAYTMAMAGASGSYLGVDIKDVTAEKVSALKLKEERGCEITTVDQDAPAGKAGLKEKDVILEFNGQRVEGEESLRRMLRETPAGRTVALGISRDGQPMTINVTLGDRAKLAHGRVYTRRSGDAPRVITIPDVEFRMPDIEIPAIEVMARSTVGAGMMIDNLTPQLGEYFGVKDGHGVLVRSVEKGSAAEAAGLKAGDVIVKINNEEIADRTDLRRTLRGVKGKTSITVIRDKREQTFTINLGGKSESSWMRFDFDVDSDFELDLDLNALEVEDLESALREKIRSVDPELASQLARQRVLSAKKASLEKEAIRKQAERVKELQREMQLLQLRDILRQRT